MAKKSNTTNLSPQPSAEMPSFHDLEEPLNHLENLTGMLYRLYADLPVYGQPIEPGRLKWVQREQSELGALIEVIQRYAEDLNRSYLEAWKSECAERRAVDKVDAA